MRRSERTARIVGCALTMLCAAQTALSGVAIVRDGEPRAVVVTAAAPSAVAAYAAEELVNHVEKATGHRLPIAAETDIPEGYDSRVFVGVTDAARRQGIDPDALELEACVLRTVGNDLYIVGRELHREDYQGARPQGEPWNPLSAECVHSGTLFGVYELLGRYLGVRWLWPGELGTYVPQKNAVDLHSIDEIIQPRLRYRDLGGWSLEQVGLTGSRYGRKQPLSYQYSRLNEAIIRKLVFPTEEVGFEYGRAMDVFNRRHGRAMPIENSPVLLASHTIAGVEDWWARYGAEHPEWFAMRADGQRGLASPRSGGYTPLCVSNPQLYRCIVDEAWDGGDVLTLGEADAAGPSMCHCADCRAWDGPQQDDVPELFRDYKYTPRAMGDRYARYWKTIYDMAVVKNPEVKVAAYLYHNTLPAPTSDIQLNENIFGEFVIYGGWDGWYPMTAEEDRWYRDQWRRWDETGISLVYGPNYLLATYVTPNVTTHQTGQFLKFAYEHGMVGVNFRSYIFSWATQGPMAYMHYRLVWDPELEIEAVRREYFSAFGPAAEHVEKYFDYWEQYTRDRPSVGSPQTGDTYGAVEKLRRPLGHYLAYPPEVYAPAQAILDGALEAARTDPLPEFARRVQFLRDGLEHAQLTTRLQAFIDYGGRIDQAGAAPLDDPEKLSQARQAMAELIRFRQDPEHRFVGDYMGNATIESQFISDIETLFGADDGNNVESREYEPVDEIF